MKKFGDLFIGLSDKQIIETIYKVALSRIPSETEVDHALAEFRAGTHTYRKLFMRLILSPEFVKNLDEDSTENHLYFIHNTRIKLIMYVLPEADVILDIGGANGSLIEYGYPYAFKKLILTDLPPESRIEELKSVDLINKWRDRKEIEIVYASMTDLSNLESNSVNLVWAGQVVEHVSQEDLMQSLSEISRVLQKNGLFCFDTPNGVMARIHSPVKLLHPEHKREYTPDEMRKMLDPYFTVEQELGLVPMPISYKTREFSYTEMVVNNTFSDKLEHSYIMFFKCRKKEL